MSKKKTRSGLAEGLLSLTGRIQEDRVQGVIEKSGDRGKREQSAEPSSWIPLSHGTVAIAIDVPFYS